MGNCKNCSKEFTLQKTCGCDIGNKMSGFCTDCIELLGLDVHDEDDWRARFDHEFSNDCHADGCECILCCGKIKSYIIKILKERDAYWQDILKKLLEKPIIVPKNPPRITWGELKLFITAEKLKSFEEGKFHSNNLIHDIVADKLNEAIEVFRRVMQDNPLTPPEQAEAFEREAEKLTSKPCRKNSPSP